MILALGVGLAGGVGAMLRYLVGSAVQNRPGGAWPRGTFTVNVAGSLVLGVIVGLVTHQDWSPTFKVLAGTGFCGGFTTWSAATWETLEFAGRGSPLKAAGYIFGSVAACACVAALGFWTLGST